MGVEVALGGQFYAKVLTLAGCNEVSQSLPVYRGFSKIWTRCDE